MELNYGDIPDVKYFKVFGCEAWVFIPIEKCSDKLSPKSELMTFVGYESGSKAYRFMNSNNNLIISAQATFFEDRSPRLGKNEVITTKDSVPILLDQQNVPDIQGRLDSPSPSWGRQMNRGHTLNQRPASRQESRLPSNDSSSSSDSPDQPKDVIVKQEPLDDSHAQDNFDALERRLTEELEMRKSRLRDSI